MPLDMNVISKKSEKIKTQKFKYTDSANVEHEMFCHTGNHWSQGIVAEGLKKNL
jgi:hypothetical protein